MAWDPCGFLLPAPFVYLLLTAGFPYTVVMLALVSAWLAARALVNRRPRALVPLAAGWGFGIGLAAPAWLSLLTYMAGSGTFAGGGGGKTSRGTVPLSALPGLILPDWTTPWHDFANLPSTHAALELAGALVPLAGAGRPRWVCRRRALWRAVRWELALAGVVLALCILPSPGVFPLGVSAGCRCFTSRWRWRAGGRWGWCYRRGAGVQAVGGVA